MKKLAILILLVLELAVSGCGTSSPSTVTNTATSGFWETQLIGGMGEASKLNFVTGFDVTNSGPLDVTSFSFFNSSACFANGLNGSTETGTASFTTNTGTDQVTGQLTFTVTSVTPPGNVLTLTSPAGGLTGTSNGTSTTTGTLSGGIAVGTWQLTGGSGDASCTGQGTFTMCQATATCTVP
jgi:hypothetical protein